MFVSWLNLLYPVIYEKEQNKLKAKKKEINRNINRSEFMKYIMETYEISSLPKQFYLKVAEINNGNDKRVSEGISYEDLLIMFKKKKAYLDKVASNNVTKGKEMQGYLRLNYDLAIILNKYDSYKAWKRQQQLLQADLIQENKKLKEETKIDYSKIKAEHSIIKDEVDIGDILDDIY
jgi:predicted transport protein